MKHAHRTFKFRSKAATSPSELCFAERRRQHDGTHALKSPSIRLACTFLAITNWRWKVLSGARKHQLGV